MESTQWNDSFTKEDYIALVAKLYSGEITVSIDPSLSVTEIAETVTVTDLDYLFPPEDIPL